MNIFNSLSISLSKFPKSKRHIISPGTWKLQGELYKRRNPIRYFFTEHVLWGLGQLTDFRGFGYWLYNISTKSHISETGLKPGKYHGRDEVMLYSIFGIIVDYVEVECAYEWVFCNSSKYRFTPWQKFKHNFTKFRNPKFGVEFLCESVNGTSLERLEFDHRVLQLYKWWTFDRPRRILPDVFSVQKTEHLESYIDELFKTDSLMVDMSIDDIHDKYPELVDSQKEIYEECERAELLQQWYDAEDQFMAKRAIDIRLQLQ